MSSMLMGDFYTYYMSCLAYKTKTFMAKEENHPTPSMETQTPERRSKVMNEEDLRKFIHCIAEDIKKYPEQLELQIELAYLKGYSCGMRDVIIPVKKPKKVKP